MPAEHTPLALKLKTANGRYRVDIPAISVEAEGPEEFLKQIETRLAELAAAFDELGEELEMGVMKHLEQHVTPRGATLKKLVAKHPAPPQWHEEPEWADDEPGQ